MKTKIIVLLLVLSAVMFSGCAGDEQSSPEENVTVEENVTQEEVSTPEETETPVVTETEEEITADENETEEVIAEENATEEVTADENETEEEETGTTSIRTTAYTIRLDNYRAYPTSLDILKGETVAWLNYQDSPRRVFTLVSEQGLFENESLVYRRSFVYTFNETGAYNFTVIGQPKMDVSITVSEP